MKGTRLWHEAGSPLIRGASQRTKPLWTQWFRGAVTAVAIGAVLVVWFVMGAVPQGGPTASGVIAVSPVLAGIVLVVCLGALVGAWFARKMGWRPEWMTAAVLGVVSGSLGVALAFSYIVIWVGK